VNRISLISNFIKNLNNEFPSGNIPTQLYEDKEVVDVRVKSSDNFIAVVGDNSCTIYCFRYGLSEDPILIKRIKILEKMLKHKVDVKIQHIVMQRYVKNEQEKNNRSIIGNVW
jgi:hypothetical protein